jgi:hypothetical protein
MSGARWARGDGARRENSCRSDGEKCVDFRLTMPSLPPSNTPSPPLPSSLLAPINFQFVSLTAVPVPSNPPILLSLLLGSRP